MPEPPLITVVTPCFNPGPKLAATIDSVLGQNISLFEYVIIDGDSTDGTAELLRGYEASLDWTAEPDRGPYDAMNKGIARSKGSWLYFLGAGDKLRAGVLSEIAPILSAQQTSAMAYGNVDMSGRIYDGPWSASKFRRGHNICQQAIFYSRDIFERLGVFDLRYRVMADHALNMHVWGDIRIAKVYVDKFIADYEGGGLSDQQMDEALMAEYPELVRKDLGLWQYLLYRGTRMLPEGLRRSLRG